MPGSLVPRLLRRAQAHPALAAAAFVVAAGAQFWATQVIVSVELPESLLASEGEEVVLAGLGEAPRLLSLEERGSLDVRFDQAALAPVTAMLLRQVGIAPPPGAGPLAWISAAGAQAPSLLEVTRGEGAPAAATLRLRPLPSPTAGVARLELEADGPLAVTLGAALVPGQAAPGKRLRLGETEVAIDASLPLQLALPPAAALRFALALTDSGGAAGLTPGILGEGAESEPGLAMTSFGLRRSAQPPATFACAARPRAWLWRGARSLGRGECAATGATLRLVALELAPGRLTLGLAGSAWLWRDGLPVGPHLLARLSANPALLALLLMADGVLVAWLALAVLNLRRRGRYLVFISYRRGDSAGHAGRLRDCLVESLGADAVFMDVADIPAGAPFDKVIAGRIRGAQCVVVVISRYWLDARDAAGQRRLLDPADWVRREVETALALGKRVIPVLVGGATMPAQADLPESLAALPGLNAVTIEDVHFHRDAEALAEVVDGGGAPVPAAG